MCYEEYASKSAEDLEYAQDASDSCLYINIWMHKQHPSQV